MLINIHVPSNFTLICTVLTATFSSLLRQAMAFVTKNKISHKWEPVLMRPNCYLTPNVYNIFSLNLL